MPFAPVASRTTVAPGRIEFSGERLVNYLPEQGQGVSELQALGREGHETFATLAAGNIVQGLISMGGALYAACAGQVFRVTTAGAVTSLGNVTDAPARMAANRTQVAIATGGTYYLATATSLSTPTVSALAGGVTDVAFGDSYFILSGDTGAGRADAMTISALNDGTSFDPLDVFFAEMDPDALVGLQYQAPYFFAIGRDTYEVFQNTGDAAQPWQPTGTFQGTDGAGSRESIVFTRNATMWVQDDGSVMAAPDFVAQEVSTPLIKEIFAANSITSSHAATHRGHELAIWRFADRPALVYDLTAGAWVEFSTGAEVESPYLITSHAELNGVEYFGTSTGRIVTRSRTVYEDAGDYISASITAPPVASPRRYITFPTISMAIQGGGASIGRQPEAWIQTSRDGRVWSDRVFAPLGDEGEYFRLAEWNGLGAQRDRHQFRVGVTDPVPRDVMGGRVGR